MTSKQKKVGYLVSVIILAIIVISFFYSLPYTVMKPGEAHDLNPAINVEDGRHYEKGDFMYMTVQVVQGINIYQYIMAKWLPYHQLIPTQHIRMKCESEKEYTIRQMHYMDESQMAAAYVAYERAGKNPHIDHNGLRVIGIIDGMPADGKIELKDVIIGADGKQVRTRKDLFEIMDEKKKGDTVDLKIIRDGEEVDVTVSVAPFSQECTNIDENTDRVGIGIQQVPDMTLQASPPVAFDTGKVGGPSGGLMFTLEIFNQLTEENWTKGYKIAGTGEMNMAGKVGSIGGIREKVVAADEQNVDVFFAPEKDHNFKDAVQTAEDIGTDMDIVPVRTIDDALSYLEKLPPKDKEQKAS